MTLYLLRHGLAEPVRAGRQDRDRSLTPEGRQRIELQALAFREAGVAPDHIVSSPYLRARQTADLVGASLGVAVEPDGRLACGATVEGILDLIREAGNPAQMLLVGHQPDLGYITQALTGSVIAVREGTLIAIDAPEPGLLRCRLAEVYDPDVMVSSGRTLREGQG